MATLTNSFIDRLRNAVIPEPQAKAILDGLRHDMDLDQLVSKQDLKQEISELKADLFKWLVPLLLGQAGFIVALIKLI